MWLSKVCVAVLCACATATAISSFPRPDHTQHAKLARWLVHSAEWGTLSTLFRSGIPVGGVVSFSDGAVNNPSGRLFFYLTPMDETAHNLKYNPSCSLTVAESQLLPNGCGSTDPEDPTCAKISVLGRMAAVTEARDAAAATAALFSRHPAMQSWPQDHGFTLYELHINEIHMLDWYGGMHIIPADEYFAASLTAESSESVTTQQKLLSIRLQQSKLQRMIRRAGPIAQ